MDTQTIIAIVNIVLGLIGGFGGAALFIGTYKHKVDTLEKKVDALEGEVKQLSHDLTQACTKLEERTVPYSSRLLKRKSPISLSGVGEELLKRSEADIFVNNNKDELIQSIRNMHPKTAYDVQIDTKKVIESLQNEDRFIPLKNYAYKEGIELDDIITVMAIHLRDLALPILGFTRDDIDKHDPKNNHKE